MECMSSVRLVKMSPRVVSCVTCSWERRGREEEERHHSDVMNAMFEAALKDESMKIVRSHFHRSLTPCIILSYRMHLLVTIRLNHDENSDTNRYPSMDSPGSCMRMSWCLVEQND